MIQYTIEFNLFTSFLDYEKFKKKNAQTYMYIRHEHYFVDWNMIWFSDLSIEIESNLVQVDTVNL